MFDPKRIKEVFQEFGLNFMDQQLRWFDPEKPVGNYGIHLLNDIISGYLVDLKDEVNVYLPTVHQWLDFAIERKEVFGEGNDLIFHHARLFRSKALALWMTYYINAEIYWLQSFELWKDFDGIHNIYGKSLKTDFLDDFMQLCVQCKQYQAGIDRYEQYHGKKEISIKRKLTPREYGYLLCLNHLEPKHSAIALVECGERMLSKYMEEPWLRMGLYSYAATWLKIVYWDHQVTADAFDTIQKAYDCMPNTERL